MTTWLLLHYKLPAKPSAPRVYIWRKLKRLGAVLLHDAVWVLPDSSRTAEQYEWLAAEIEEMGGEAFYWKAGAVWDEHEDSIIRKFNEQADTAYSDLLKRIEGPRADLQQLSQEFQQAVTRDFFGAALSGRVRQKLLSKRGESR